MTIKVEGKCGVSATVVADSISVAGIRLMTFEITYPRIILSEANTHRMLSKNSASSRAIPFKKMKENLTGRPVRFGAANPGMQDTGEDFEKLIEGRDIGEEEYSGVHEALTAQQTWDAAREDALFWSEAFHNAGYAKQVYNRLTEPFQMMKTVLSGTELENFFWLRDDGAADPSLAELARCMREARDANTPQLLQAGDWHLPYVNFDNIGWQYWIEDSSAGPLGQLYLSTEDAIKVSCARAAAVSFRNTDYGLEKCKDVYVRLVGDERKHASALEHQATPMQSVKPVYIVGETVNLPFGPGSWQDGVSHVDRKGQLWSGNFRGFIQHRKTIAGENKPG